MISYELNADTIVILDEVAHLKSTVSMSNSKMSNLMNMNKRSILGGELLPFLKNVSDECKHKNIKVTASIKDESSVKGSSRYFDLDKEVCIVAIKLHFPKNVNKVEIHSVDSKKNALVSTDTLDDCVILNYMFSTPKIGMNASDMALSIIHKLNLGEV